MDPINLHDATYCLFNLNIAKMNVKLSQQIVSDEENHKVIHGFYFTFPEYYVKYYYCLLGAG